MPHNILENTRITTLAAGTFINTTAVGGTAGGVVSAADYEYHAVYFAGTFANHGTINVYACENSAGSSPRLIASLPVGSGNGQYAGIDVKSDFLGTFSNSGTNYAFLSAAGTVEAGGTWRGALVIQSQWPRTAGTTPTALGAVAYGSALY
jgi:hypothetical protein